MADRSCVSLPLLTDLLKKHPRAGSSLNGLYLLAEDRVHFPEKKKPEKEGEVWEGRKEGGTTAPSFLPLIHLK